MTIIEYAPAKLNLGLKVLRRRDDGYHDILSIFQTVTLFDLLTISDNGLKGLTCTPPDAVSCDDDNLVLRAERATLAMIPGSRRLRYELDKTIPIGGGLAGGSSDAAATIRGVNSLHGSPLDEDQLLSIAGSIGSDVPFLISGGTAVVTSRGEHVTRVKWPFSFVYVIAFPGFGVSTAWAYQNLTGIGTNSEPLRELANQLIRGDVVGETLLISALENDFTVPVFGRHPELAHMADVLAGSGAVAAFLTGSGASVVGMFRDEHAARTAAASIAPPWRVFVAEPTAPA